MARLLVLAFSAVVALQGATSAAWCGTLEDARSAGVVTCGLDPAREGISKRAADYSWTGMAPELCRAIAAAVLGNPERVNLVALTQAEQILALQSGEIDVLFPTGHWSAGADSADGLMATVPYLYEGISLLQLEGAGEAPLSIDGADVCFIADAMSATWYRQAIGERNGRPSEVASVDELKAVIEAGGCPFIAGRHFSWLGQLRESAELHEGFFGVLSYAPVVRQGDDQWFHVVREVIYELIRAAESKSTQAQARATAPPQTSVAPLQWAGLAAAWPHAVILATGNLQEIFDRNFGAGAKTTKAAGLNATWNEGGLWYAPSSP